MKLNIRKLNEADWSTLEKWWDGWPEWKAPAKDFLPDNGTGGFIVEKNQIPIVAGFIYFTNSKGAMLEWIVSNPDYKQNDRQKAIEYLISTCEAVLKEQGFKYVFSIGRNKSLIETHKKLNWIVDPNHSHEIIKVI